MALRATEGLDIDCCDATRLLRKLIAAQADGEAAVQAILADRLADAGVAIETLSYDPGTLPLIGEFTAGDRRPDGPRTCLIATLPGDPNRRSLLVFAHPDSEPVAGTAQWHHDPFAGDAVDGRLYGWGVADDLAGLAAGAEALIAAAADLAPRGPVFFVSAPSKRHARGVAAALEAGITADAALYLHPAESGAGLGEVKACAAGLLECRITVTGHPPDTTEPGHAAFAHLAVNPVDKAVVIYDALMALDTRRAARLVNTRLQAAVGRSTNLMVSAIEAGSAERLGRVAERCSLGIAVSLPPGETVEDAQADIAAAVAEAAAGDAWLSANPPRIDWLAGVTGAECPEDHAFWQATAAAVAEVTGNAPRVNPLHTASDIRNPMVQKGIPTLGLGGLAGNLTQNGLTDEWVDLADYHRTVATTLGVIRRWCGTSKDRAP